MTDLPILFDAETVAAIQQLLGLGWPEPWRIITLLGTNWGILLVLGLAFWLWGRRLAYGILAVVVVDGIVKMALNKILFVPRPDAGAIVKYEHVGVGSFPSGHVSTATAVWGYLAHRGPLSWAWPIAVALLEGLSRLYLGVHFVGDILGGYLLAAFAVWVVGRWWGPVRDQLARIPFGAWALLAVLVLAGTVAGAFFFYGENPYQWRAGGLVAGLAIALPLEYRFVRYDPGEEGWGRKAAKVLIGVAGIALCAFVDLWTGERSYLIGLVATALAAIWTVLVAPTTFALLGWSRKEEPRREVLVRRTARAIGVATLVLLGVLGYGMGIEPRLMLDTEQREARVPNLPSGWEGATVAVASDFQLGLWLDNRNMMRRAVQRIIERRPALVLLPGDFIYHPGDDPTSKVAGIMEILRPLAGSDIPTYAVLGNHDWGLTRPMPEDQPNREAGRELRDSLEAAGIPVLHNRSEVVRHPESGDSLYVVGIGSHWFQADSAAVATAGVPGSSARLVMMHNPASFPALGPDAAPLAVAGHTHGGQVRIPLTPEWSYLTFVRADEVHVDGWIEESFGAEGNRLYVTRGIGMSLLPLRINAPPELTFLTLRSQTETATEAEGDPG